MIFDDNSNFAFTIGRLKTLSFDKEYYNALVTVSELHSQAALITVVLSPCNDGTYCPVLSMTYAPRLSLSKVFGFKKPAGHIELYMSHRVIRPSSGHLNGPSWYLGGFTVLSTTLIQCKSLTNARN